MKNWKLIGVLLLSVMLMASGCDKNGSSPDSSTTASSNDKAVTTAVNEENEPDTTTVTKPLVTRADGGVIDEDEAVDVDESALTTPAETTSAEPTVTKEQKVELIEDDDKAIEGGDSEGMAEIIEAALSEDKNSGYDSPDISGTWTENGKEANNISIEKVEGNVYKATIIKNYEHSSGALWELVLRYEDGKFVYSSAKKHTFSYASGSLESTEVYSDGTGSLVLEDGHLTWTDDKEDQGNGLVFSKE